MTFINTYLFIFIWATFHIYWQIGSHNVKLSEQTEPRRTFILRSVLLLAAVALLVFYGIPLGFFDREIFPYPSICWWAGAVITIAGLIFSGWARQRLGRNWSVVVSIKTNHELVTDGPYAMVRHPLYTGLLLGFLGSVIALDKWRGMLSFILVFAIFWNKLRLEEKWMLAHFGSEYEKYSKCVARLVPFIF